MKGHLILSKWLPSSRKRLHVLRNEIGAVKHRQALSLLRYGRAIANQSLVP
jgi:hypothetical protein